jgi:hypothetical protein
MQLDQVDSVVVMTNHDGWNPQGKLLGQRSVRCGA